MDAHQTNWLLGGGEMGNLIREKDWSQTPLGPIQDWPQSLITAMSICLNATMPFSIIWGPELVQIYNDAYIAIAVGRHPRILGGKVPDNWPDTWPGIKDYFREVFDGRSVYVQHALLPTTRGGIDEETYYTMSFSPVRNEHAEVVGVFHAIQDTTSEVLHERRLRTTRHLAAELADATTTKEIFARTMAVLEKNPNDVPFALCYEIADGTRARQVALFGVPSGSSISPELVDLETSANSLNSWPFTQAACCEQREMIVDLGGQLTPAGIRPAKGLVSRAMALPIMLPGETRPVALLVAGLSPWRVINEEYKAFFAQIAATVATAVANVRAYEAERKRAESLAELDRAKTTFLSNVSHEFRTPLTLLLGPLEEEMGSNPAARERLEVAYRNALRLLKLVNTLLDFARIEAGRIEASYELTDLAMVTADLASVFRSAIEKAGLRLIIDCPPLPQPVYVDREMWEKIVLNLLSNAFKFTFQGEIRVSLRQPGDWVELAISDTGVGIPAAELNRIFERFHRVRVGRARSHEGTGIGLALVQELVKLHGGDVVVESTEGRGTTFTVRIRAGMDYLPKNRIGQARTLDSTSLGAQPFVEEALRWLPSEGQVETSLPVSREDTSVTALAEKDRPPHEQRSIVLLVEDNADMRDYIRRLLTRDYEIVTAPDGMAALAVLHEQKIDLVISDVMMPRMDGFDFLRALRADPKLRITPVILLSARAGEEARLEGLHAGADSYLIKPFSARELIVHVEKDLAMARIRREAAQRTEAILHSITDAFFALDQRWRFAFVNAEAERVLRKSAKELIGANIWDLFPNAERFRHYYEQAAATGQAIHFESFYPPLEAWFEVHAYPSEEGLSIYFRDVTDRKKAQQQLQDHAVKLESAVAERTAQLRETVAELEHFSYSITHDMRAPLRAMRSFASLLLNEYSPALPEEAQNYLQRIGRAADRMDRLIEDALDYSKAVREHLPLTHIDPAALLRSIIESYPAFQPPNAQIQIRGMLPPVLANHAGLTQCFSNLLNNAVKFVRPGEVPRVHVWAERRDSMVRLWFEDNGIGIPAESQERIFDMFQRLDRSYEGTGIGLALVRKVSERMGGEVGVESEPGKGSHFWLDLRTSDEGTGGIEP